MLVAGASMGFMARGYMKKTEADAARQARVDKIIEHFKSCPDKFRVSKSCLTPQERQHLISKANSDKMKGNYEEAGMAYIELGMEDEAREMAAECRNEGKEDARNRILDQLVVRGMAVQTTEERMNQLEAAVNHERASRFREAGIGYAKLGMREKAIDMVRECRVRGDEKGAERILEHLNP